MKRLVLAAAGAAVAGLTACSNSATPAAAPASPAASSTAPAGHASTASPPASGTGSSRHAAAAPTAAMHSAMAATCKQRYDAWQQGPGKGVVAALNAVGAAETAGDAQALTTALKQATPAVAKAARNPLPSCADPKGYWEVLLMHVNAGTASKTPSSLPAAMKSVPAITNELNAELQHTSG